MRVLLILVLTVLFSLQGAEAAKRKRGKGRTKPVAAAPYSPPAKEVFGSQKQPSPLAARSFGGYARGCIAGAKALPIDGPAWQAMRLSRNRNWGHPVLVAYLERLATDAKAAGQLAGPAGRRSGPAHGRADADRPCQPPDRPRRRCLADADARQYAHPEERENKSAISMLAEDGVTVDPKIWTEDHAKLIKRAASYPEVARIFVHPAIKKALCTWAAAKKEPWLSKVRPWWGHHYHFHVRLACPAGSQGCIGQPAAGTDDGCGKELDRWLKKLKKPAVVAPAAGAEPKPAKAKKPMTVAQLPAECAALVGLDKKPPAAGAGVPVEAVPLPERKPEPEKKSAGKDGKQGG